MATRTCAGSVCNGACAAGFADCNNNKLTDGCETNINTDPKHCGSCTAALCAGNCVNGVCQTVCRPSVLVLGEGTAADMQLVSVLQQNGMTPTLVPNWSPSVNGGYVGTPAASGFGTVIVLAGINYSVDMPAAGQQSIVAATAGGTGVVFLTWSSYEIAATQNRFQMLKPIAGMLYGSGVNSTGAPTYTNTVAHPVWTGLPASFTFTATTIGLTVPSLINGASAIATYSCTNCTAGTAAVSVHDTGVYRVVDDASSPNYMTDTMPWSDPNRAKLIVNMAKWTAHCM
jgi:hypothetical protein